MDTHLHRGILLVATILIFIKISFSQWSWKPIGPAPLNFSKYPYTISHHEQWSNVSARINTIAVSENYDGNGNPAVFIGPEGGGIWRATDFENHNPTWINITDSYSKKIKNLTTRSMLQTASNITIDPNHPNIIYAVVSNLMSYCSRQSLIIKSIDGGNKWDTLPGVGNNFISKVIIDPTDKSGNSIFCLAFPNILYAWNVNSQKWEPTKSSGLPVYNINTLFDCDYTIYNNKLSLYLAVRNGTSVQIWKSDDKGVSWFYLPFSGQNNPNMIRALDGKLYAPNDKIINILLAGTHNVNQEGMAIAIYAKNDNGKNYPQVFVNEGELRFFLLNIYSVFKNTLIPNYNQYANLNGFNVTSSSYAFGWNPYQNQYYVGGTEDVRTSDLPNYKWKDISSGSNNIKPHPDNHAMAFYKNHVFLCNDGGIYDYDRSKNEWYTLNNNTLQTILANGVSIHPTAPSNIIIGNQDNAIGLFNQFNNNSQKILNNTWFAEANRCSILNYNIGDASKIYFDINGRYAYTTLPYNGGKKDNFIIRSADLGSSWSCITPDDVVKKDAHLDWYPALAINPGNPSRLALGLDRIYETFNNGDNWGAAISPILKANQQSSAITYGSNNRIWVAYEDSLVISQAFKQPYTPYSWYGIKIRDKNGKSLNGKIINIVEDPDFTNTKYVATAACEIWKTEDDGSSWENITNNFNLFGALEINKLLCVKTYNKTILFIATGAGVFYAFGKNCGASCGDYTWYEFNSGLPNCRVTDIDYNKMWDYLAICTWGRGVFTVAMSDLNIAGFFNTNKPSALIHDLSSNSIDGCHQVYDGGTQKFKFSLEISKPSCIQIDTIKWYEMVNGQAYNEFITTNPSAIYLPLPLKQESYKGFPLVVNAEIKFNNNTILTVSSTPIYLDYENNPDNTGNFLLKLQEQQENNRYYVDYDWPRKKYLGQNNLNPNSTYRLTLRSPNEFQIRAKELIKNYSYSTTAPCPPRKFICQDLNVKEQSKVPATYDDFDNVWGHFKTGNDGSYTVITLNANYQNGCNISVSLPFSVKTPLSVYNPFLPTAELQKDSSILNKMGHDFEIIPNPTNGYFEIKAPSCHNNVIVQIFDATGKTILTKKVAQFSKQYFNLSKYEEGIYLIKIASNKFLSLKKILLKKH